MSRNSMEVGVVFRDLKICVSRVSRSSGTIATPTLASTVENGKLATRALPPTSALKIVDFPTLGSPMIPQFSAMLSLSNTFFTGRRRVVTVHFHREPFLNPASHSVKGVLYR